LFCFGQGETTLSWGETTQLSWGETTLSWGETTPGWGKTTWGETDLGRNDHNSVALLGKEKQIHAFK